MSSKMEVCFNGHVKIQYVYLTHTKMQTQIHTKILAFLHFSKHHWHFKTVNAFLETIHANSTTQCMTWKAVNCSESCLKSTFICQCHQNEKSLCHCLWTGQSKCLVMLSVFFLIFTFSFDCLSLSLTMIDHYNLPPTNWILCCISWMSSKTLISTQVTKWMYGVRV